MKNTIISRLQSVIESFLYSILNHIPSSTRNSSFVIRNGSTSSLNSQFSPLNSQFSTLSSPKAFTLIELIVTITILSILGVVSFTSFNDYNKTARDSVRVSDISNMKLGLDSLIIKNGVVLPPTDNTITINANTTPIGYQGYAGSSVLNSIGFNGTGKDPLNNMYYTYSTNNTYTKYQLLGLLEDSSSNISMKEKYNDELLDKLRIKNYELGIRNESILGIKNNSELASILTPTPGLNSALQITQPSSLPSQFSTPNSQLSSPPSQFSPLSSQLSPSSPIRNSSFVIFNGLNLFLPTVYGASIDYSNRIPLTRGDQLGILLGTNTGVTLNQPIQEQYNSSSFTGIDIVNYTGSIGTNSSYGNILAIFTNKTTDNISGTGLALSQIQNSMITGGSKYPGCDTYDIVVGNQVWSACNVGASNAWTGGLAFNNTGATNQPTDYNSGLRFTLGNYYQWGRNLDVTSATSFTGPVSVDGGTGFIMNSNSPYDWLTTPNDNLWGGVGTTPTSGTYISQGKPSAMQGPCAGGYHVPTAMEWSMAFVSSSSIYDTLRSNLKLPLEGSRNRSTALYGAQGNLGNYWSSSPISTNGYSLFLNSGGGNIANSNGRAFGFPIRCLKN